MNKYNAKKSRLTEYCSTARKKPNAYEIFKIKRKLMLERYGIRVREV